VGQLPIQLPHVGNAGRGCAANAHAKSFGQLPAISSQDGGGERTQGIFRESNITAYFHALAARLRRTRITCGDFARVLGPSVTFRHGLTAVFLDPPYDLTERAAVYAVETDAAHRAREWAISTMPGAGYTRSSVTTTSGTTHTLWCAGANKNQVRVVTDSGNDSDCRNDCTVMPLADYVSRNGGWAGMHGAYACPADYPACADKKNSFDTLFFNSRVKRYLNSDNNIYSVVPLVIVDTSGNTRFMSKSLEWGRDTNIQAGVASHPMLVMGKSYAINDGNLDSKQRSTKSTRGAFVQSGDNLYLCVVGNATVVDSANVFLKLGADNALNLDGGGTTALYINGRYVLGPGRALTNAIIFANK
jgi:hypothetical protein